MGIRENRQRNKEKAKRLKEEVKAGNAVVVKTEGLVQH